MRFQFTHSLMMIERIYIFCLIIIIIKSEVWTISHCLMWGHETMVYAVCLSIFLLHRFEQLTSCLQKDGKNKLCILLKRSCMKALSWCLLQKLYFAFLLLFLLCLTLWLIPILLTLWLVWNNSVDKTLRYVAKVQNRYVDTIFLARVLAAIMNIIQRMWMRCIVMIHTVITYRCCAQMYRKLLFCFSCVR